MNMTSVQVEGESAELVFGLLQRWRDSLVEKDNGMFRGRVSFDRASPEGRAFQRAFIKVDGRLAIEDRLRQVQTGEKPRLKGQRGADALLELVALTSDALARRHS